VSLVDDQDSVEQFAAEGADESVRRSRWLAVLAWWLADPDVEGGEDGVRTRR
jgi:hypothetical protein